MTLSNNPTVSYPYVDNDFNLLERGSGECLRPRDALGCCLGFSVFKYRMNGAPSQV